MSVILERTIPKTEVYQNGQVFNARLISVKNYDEMIEHGILTSDDKVELLNGIIIEKMPKGVKHAAINDLVAEIFREKLGNRAIIRNQNPIVLDDYSEPEPDLVLAKPLREIYVEKHPTPEDIYLIAEISDSTLGRDRFAKGTAYSKAGIVQYLVFNVKDKIIEDYRQPAEDGYQSKQTYKSGDKEDYRQPAEDGYQSKQTYKSGDKFNLVAFPEIEINVDDLF